MYRSLDPNKTDEFILALLRFDFDKSRENIIVLAEECIKGNYFYQRCCFHGVAPLIFKRLKSLGLHDFFEDDLIRSFENKYYWTAGENLKILNLTKRIIINLRDSNIESALLKGSAFINLIYDNIALRPMNDVDILIRKEDILGISHILQDLGYTPEVDIEHFHNFKIFDERVNNFVFYSEDSKKVKLEMHWRAAPKFFNSNLTDEFWWKELTNVENRELNFSYPTLSLENHLLYAIFHFHRHGWDRLIWLLDIGNLLHEPLMDYEKLLRKAEKIKTEKFLAYAALLSNELLGMEIPKPLQLAKNYKEDKLYCLLKRNCVRSEFKTFESFQSNLFVSYFIKNKKERYKFLYKLIFFPNFTDASIIQLPEKISFLYFIVRFLRLFLEKFRKSWKYIDFLLIKFRQIKG